MLPRAMKMQLHSKPLLLLWMWALSTMLYASELRVSRPNPPWSPTPENCRVFRLQVNEAQQALRDQLSACYRSSTRPDLANVSPIAGCYEYATKECKSMAKQVCQLRKRLEQQVEECNVKAELWRLTQDSINDTQDRRADRVVDEANDRLRGRSHRGRYDRYERGPVHALSDQITDAAIDQYRDVHRNAYGDLTQELSDFETRDLTQAERARALAREHRARLDRLRAASTSQAREAISSAHESRMREQEEIRQITAIQRYSIPATTATRTGTASARQQPCPASWSTCATAE
jgi:hypothetical protein